KAEKALEHNDLGGYRIWLIATIILGSSFLILHALEWRHLWEKGFTFSSNMYGTGFYSLTGVHASHVLLGVLIQLVLLLNSGKALGKITPIKAASYYWHFVDIAWLLVAGTAYIVGSYGTF
ncbi:MAG: cytochrome c oxidase subunit 3, partial [Hydrogenobacter thermophilus]|nr:cytochrome c oxidase subunit 3 [Hydrogenobacter thermophilus]